MTTQASPLDTIQALDIAFNGNDIEAILDFYENTAIIMTDPQNNISGKKAIRNFFEKILRLNGKAQQIKAKVIESDDLALFTSKWVFEYISETGEKITRESFANTVLRKNNQGVWKVVIDNSFGPTILDGHP